MELGTSSREKGWRERGIYYINIQKIFLKFFSRRTPYALTSLPPARTLRGRAMASERAQLQSDERNESGRICSADCSAAAELFGG